MHTSLSLSLSLSLSPSLLYSRRCILRVKESGKRTRNAIGEPVLELTIYVVILCEIHGTHHMQNLILFCLKSELELGSSCSPLLQ